MPVSVWFWGFSFLWRHNNVSSIYLGVYSCWQPSAMASQLCCTYFDIRKTPLECESNFLNLTLKHCYFKLLTLNTKTIGGTPFNYKVFSNVKTGNTNPLPWSNQFCTFFCLFFFWHFNVLFHYCLMKYINAHINWLHISTGTKSKALGTVNLPNIRYFGS